ncbi:winged helix-turn-helix transcriptional regulator [Mycoplasmatota bacterium]|nr:winged helix-turn-helix transcriptional regulator [Mycoplasmatota bacterium]
MKKDKTICECNVIHLDIIKKVNNELSSITEIEKMSVLFKVLGDQTRLKIISTLLKAEMCVCDISYLLNMSQSLISHQLRVLREARLVKFRREGKVVYYSLDDEHIEMIVQYGLEHINESGEISERD